MGFLKFLKKSKKDKLEMPFEEDLDMPPPPPMGAKRELPPMPKFEEGDISEPMEEIPKLPELEPIKEHEMPEEIPKLPEMHEFEEKPPEMRPSHPPEHKTKRPLHLERMERAAIREEKAVLRHEAVPRKPIFIRVEKFKEARRSINIIRNDLKNSDEILIKLHNGKNLKDKEFNKWQKTMEDAQKKIIFIDKTLFKGD